jgi:hypothetical protein
MIAGVVLQGLLRMSGQIILPARMLFAWSFDRVIPLVYFNGRRLFRRRQALGVRRAPAHLSEASRSDAPK